MIGSGSGFEGQVAVVTGAAGLGIGTAVARALCAAGATVVMNGTDATQICDVIETFDVAERERLMPFVADVRDGCAVNRMIAAVHERFGRLDILVHNAARGADAAPIEDLSHDVWDDDLAIILSGAFHCTRAAARLMKQQRHGRIVYVSSCAAFRGTLARGASYAVAKAGLIGLTKQVALELAPYRITVNTVAPSLVDTPRIRRKGRTDQSIQQYVASVPLGRACQPEEVAAAIAFLSSRQAGYITGQVIVIDGGSSLASRSTRLDAECAVDRR
jgi:3-oxoacyl-[acyl-carrier protein] reductase